MDNKDLDELAIFIAERVRSIAIINCPFDTGDLRKSTIVQPAGTAAASIGSNLPYARAVHDGRPAITIRPKNKKALFWEGAAHPVKVVRQKARKARPYIKDAIQEMAKDLSFLDSRVTPKLKRDLDKIFKAQLKQI